MRDIMRSGRTFAMHRDLPMTGLAVGDVAGTFALSLTAGTVFEGTRKPLRMWFLAM